MLQISHPLLIGKKNLLILYFKLDNDHNSTKMTSESANLVSMGEIKCKAVPQRQ
jgi:hypothetical protein